MTGRPPPWLLSRKVHRMGGATGIDYGSICGYTAPAWQHIQMITVPSKGTQATDTTRVFSRKRYELKRDS